MRKRWIQRLSPAVLLLLTGAPAAGLYILSTFDPGTVKAFDEVRAGYRRSDALLLDREGHIIHQLRVDSQGRRLDWIPLHEISPALTQACIAAEDGRFLEHRGADWKALAAGALQWLWAGQRRGGSTISMQVASILDSELQNPGQRRSLTQKIRQIVAAGRLERTWTKQEILETYLNLISFRGELQGVAAASHGLFNKAPHGLNEAEAVVLASLIRSPNALPETVAARALNLARSLKLPVAPEEVQRTARAGLSGVYSIRPLADLAPHVARKLLSAKSSAQERNGPLEVRSTLSMHLQQCALQALRRQLSLLGSHHVSDGAVLVVENESGEILCYIGNGGDLSSAPYVDGVQSPRQAGSTLKPFLYALALERKLLTPASLLDDSPIDISVQGGLYRPSNYDNEFHGLVSLRTALASSLNIPAVRTLQLVGQEAFSERLRQLGFSDLRPPEFYGPSLALGSADVTLWDLVNAYRALANRGKWSSLILEESAGDNKSRQVFGPEASFLVSAILADREGRNLTFGLESPLATPYWSAVKTGTSKDMRDNWCVGFSSRYTVGVWTGNFSGEPTWNTSGMTGAAPVWTEILDWLNRDTNSGAPAVPPGVVATMIPGTEGEARREWFLAGTEPLLISATPHSADARIIYPTTGSFIALDPDIPVSLQRIFFEASLRVEGLEWELDDAPFGRADRPAVWSPTPGEHRLSLRGSTGTMVDTITFAVRGSPIDAP